MSTQSPYRSLPSEKRVELLTRAMKGNRDARAAYVERIMSKGRGFRAVTLMSWPPDKLAREVVRLHAESAQDELELLQFLYLEVEPEIQATFLDAAGVSHEHGRMPEDLEPPYVSDAAAVERGAAAVRAAHGEDGARYLRTLARYARDGWPGIERLVDEPDAAAGA